MGTPHQHARALPALKVLLPYALGLSAGKYFDCSPVSLQIIFFASLPLVALLFLPQVRQSHYFYFLSACCLLNLGLLQHELAGGFFSTHHITNFTDQKEAVTLVGTVTAYPEVRSRKTHLLVEMDSLLISERALHVEGKVLLIIPKGPPFFNYGDRLRFAGRLKKPARSRNPGEFDYREYLAAQDIFATMSVTKFQQIVKISTGNGNWFFRSAVVPTKVYLDEFITNNLPQDEAALLRGLLIGERGEISKEIRDNFSKLGVIHILAVSGLHVGFIVVAFMTLAGVLRCPYRTRVVLTILLLIFYAYLTNLKPSVLRAATMVSFLLLGTVVERKTVFYNSVTLAAFLILLFRPLDLFQAGFQLSFAAVLAIVYLYPRLRLLFPIKNIYAAMPAWPLLQYPLDLFVVSLAAFIGTLPLTALYFYRLPNLSLLANIFVVPLSFVGLGCSMAGAFVNLVSSGLAEIYMATSWLTLHAIIKLVEFGSSIPYAYFAVYWFDPIVSCLYCALLLLLFEWRNIGVRRGCIFSILLLGNVWLWRGNLNYHQKMQVTFVDIGQGDSVLLHFPDGRKALIDGGKRSLYFDAGSSIVAPYLRRHGVQKIDVLILSHADSDHLGGFPYLLRHFEIGEVWDNGQKKETKLFKEYHHLIDSLNIRHRFLKTGDVIRDFEPAVLYILHPTDNFIADAGHSANDASLSLKLSYGQTDFLFLGDIEKNGEALVSRFGPLLKSEVLKVSHHGSRTSSTSRFLKYASPELAVISVGERNNFGHPTPEVLQRLSGMGTNIIRTDQEGAIILRTDGQSVERINWH